MEGIVELLSECGYPFAYDHFAEGHAADPPFICYLIPRDDNFAADGIAYHKINVVHIELYTDKKDLAVEGKVEAVLDGHGIFFMTGLKPGSSQRNCTRSFIHLKWR